MPALTSAPTPFLEHESAIYNKHYYIGNQDRGYYHTHYPHREEEIVYCCTLKVFHDLSFLIIGRRKRGVYSPPICIYFRTY